MANKIRNSKSEIRNKFEARNQKQTEIPRQRSFRLFRNSNFGFVSDFVLRISDLFLFLWCPVGKSPRPEVVHEQIPAARQPEPRLPCLGAQDVRVEQPQVRP